MLQNASWRMRRCARGREGGFIGLNPLSLSRSNALGVTVSRASATSLVKRTRLVEQLPIVRGIIDADADLLPADARLAIDHAGLSAVDAMPNEADATKLLDVEMD
jgi:hypothetical protein